MYYNTTTNKVRVCRVTGTPGLWMNFTSSAPQIVGFGTIGTIPVFTDTTQINDSSITDNGNTTTFGATTENVFNSVIRNSEASTNSNNIFQLTKNNWSPSDTAKLISLNASISANQAIQGISSIVTRNNGATNLIAGGEFFAWNYSASTQQNTYDTIPSPKGIFAKSDYCILC
jgi:hypothetical protein